MTWDPLRWADVAMALVLALTSGAAIAVSVARDGQRLRLAGTLILAVALTGGQLSVVGQAYTWITWTLAVGLAVSVVGMIRYLARRWPAVRAGKAYTPSRGRRGDR